MRAHVLAIDQGTTGTTVMIFDAAGGVRGRAYSEFRQFYPKPGWVEHDPEEIWCITQRVIRAALRSARLKPADVAAIGITNQRETVVLWDRRTGKPVHRAIVWQDRRTAPICDALKAQGAEPTIHAKTGLVTDPYFSGTKLQWLFDHVKGTRAKAARLAFGTIDTWLIWKLTGGKSHLTDYTNASRTLLFNIREQRWDDELLRLLNVPRDVLPRVVPSAGVAATTDARAFGAEVPIAGVAGDQQAALFGQACFHPGLVKNTYGTGCFILMYTGDTAVDSKRGLLTTMACAADGRPAYAVEGSVFIAGAAVQWLRDGLKLLQHAKESERHARRVDSTLGVYLVPAFVGLGAPYWDAAARGALVGLTRGVTKAHVVRATLEALAYQTRDVVDTMVAESGRPLSGLRVDGGAAANNFLMQFQADILGVTVDRPKVIETTALGAALLAGLGVGLWKSERDLERVRRADRVFRPHMAPEHREALYQGWRRAVAAVRSLGS
ncbi:MAG TPA: glycerol kinase GlpK [Candidatus Margulisiibacteriota bacterium]|nr:glycerol kinase GlpK [Candidatus Margulisiibacteriota bacterium]